MMRRSIAAARGDVSSSAPATTESKVPYAIVILRRIFCGAGSMHLAGSVDPQAPACLRLPPYTHPMPLDLTRFEILTFDCYGTLIDWESGILPVLRSILAAHNKKVDDPTLLQLYGDFEQRAENPYQPYRDVLASVVRQFGEHLGFTPTKEEEQSLPNSLAQWPPWPDTVAALRELKTRYRLAILSNVDDDLFAATRPKLGVEFDEVITAQQAQAYKPSLKIFELALQRINTPKDRVLHVGQSIYHDVIPAQKLGLATVWVNRPSVRPGVGAVKSATANPDLTVMSLADLAKAALKP